MPPNDSKKLDLLLQEMGAIREKMCELKQEVHQLNKYVFIGNGKPSLIARVEVNENNLSELKWWKRATITGLSTGIFGIALAIVERLM